MWLTGPCPWPAPYPRCARPAIPDHADIGCEFAGEFVAHAQSQLGLVEAPADVMSGNVLRREVDLRTRLQNQPLGDPLVDFDLGTGGEIAPGREECGRIDLDAIWRDPLDADHGARAVPAREVVKHAHLKVEERPDRMAPQRLHFDPFGPFPALAFAFALEPEFVEVTPDITLRVPEIAVTASTPAIFESIHLQHDPCMPPFSTISILREGAIATILMSQACDRDSEDLRKFSSSPDN